jgi:polyvinyl alcohol dehydrogenase (cytochrome)
MKQRMLRVVSVLTTVAAASAIAAMKSGTPTNASSTSGRASGVDQRISGKRLVLMDNSNVTQSRISVVSNDRAITLGGGDGSADDPTQFGGSLRIRTSNGDLFDGSYDLPMGGWTGIGPPGQNGGFRFKSTTGPIRSVVVSPGRRIKVVGKGAFTHTLSTNPNPVGIVLRTGAKRYCMEFGGTTTFQAATRFRATDGPAPASCPAAADWPLYGFDLTRNRFNPNEGLINGNTVSRLNVRWFFSTGAGTAAVSASPSVVDGVVYVGSWNGTMYALDASSGQPLWTFNINDPNPGDRSGFPGIQSSAAVVNGMVYFGAADANVYALDAHSGAMVWKTSLGNPDTSVEGAHVWSSPAVFNGKVYVGKSSHLDAPCVRGALVALDAASGAEVWRFETLPENVCSNDTQLPCSADADCSGGSCIPFLVCRSGSGEQSQSQLCSSDADCMPPTTCQRPLGGGVTSSPAIDAAKGAVYVSVGDCVGSGATGLTESLLALDAETGALRWVFKPIPTGDLQDLDFVASPNVFAVPAGTSQSLVGAGNKNGIYYAVDQDTGALIWQQSVVPGGVLGGFNASTGVAFGNIYAGTFTGPPFLFALGTTDGHSAWQCPSTECNSFSFGPAGIAAGVLFMGDGAGVLRAFDATTGAVLRKLVLGGGISSGPAIVNDMVIVGVGTGIFGTGQTQGVYGLALQ